MEDEVEKIKIGFGEERKSKLGSVRSANRHKVQNNKSEISEDREAT